MEIMTEFKGDKRTKEYKEWKAKHTQASEGLGDTVEKITKATGIKKAVDTVFQKLEKSCGCEERKEKLNQVFRYKKPECLTEQEFDLIKMAVDTKKNKWTPEEQETYKNIYERIFKTKVECTPCSFGKVVWKDLQAVYNQYL
jgi:isopentenyldiphosphate isomerase